MGLDKKFGTGFFQINNLEWDGSALLKRKGRVKVDSTTRNNRGLYGFQTVNGWRRILAAGGSLFIYKDLKDPSKNRITQAGFNENNFWSFAGTVTGKVIAVNGIDSVMIDQYGFQNLVIDPGVSQVVQFHGYMIGTGPNSIQWSRQWTPAAWPLLFFNPIGSGNYTGLSAMHNLVVVFEKRRMHAILYQPAGNIDDPWVFREDIANVGCIAPQSIATNGESVFFLSDRYAHYFDGGAAIPIMVGAGIEDLPLTDRQNAVGVWYRDRYYRLSIGNTTYIYDTFTRTARTSTTPSTGVAHVELDYKGELLTAGATSAPIWKHDITNLDGGEAIPITLEVNPIYAQDDKKQGMFAAPRGLDLEIWKNGNHDITISHRAGNKFDVPAALPKIELDATKHEWNEGKWGTGISVAEDGLGRWNGAESEAFLDQSFVAANINGKNVRIKLTETSGAKVRIKGFSIGMLGKSF